MLQQRTGGSASGEQNEHDGKTSNCPTCLARHESKLSSSGLRRSASPIVVTSSYQLRISDFRNEGTIKFRFIETLSPATAIDPRRISNPSLATSSSRSTASHAGSTPAPKASQFGPEASINRRSLSERPHTVRHRVDDHSSHRWGGPSRTGNVSMSTVTTKRTDPNILRNAWE